MALTTALQIYVSLTSTGAEYVLRVEAVLTVVWLEITVLALSVQQDSSHIIQDSEDCYQWANGRPEKHFSWRRQIDI